MSWEQWPFRPRSLTDMVGPGDDKEYSERFVSLLVSGCSERLDRSLTVLEPELDSSGHPAREPDPDNPGKTRLQLRRIEQINPREHFTQFCDLVHQLPGQEQACYQCDEDIARRVFQKAIEDPEGLAKLIEGISCRLDLVGQAGVVRCHQTPVAVVLSGQFLSDGENAREQIGALIDDLAAEYGLSDAQRRKLRAGAAQLETRDEFIQRYIREVEQQNLEAAAALARQEPTVPGLFTDTVKEIERIACAQFHMHKRNQESAFRHQLRQAFPSLLANSRGVIAERIQPILEKVLQFCGTEYLALFVSPRRYISYEDNPNLLPPFAVAGTESMVESGILHINWRKANLMSIAQANPEQTWGESPRHSQAVPSFRIWTRRENVQRALKGGLKGKQTALFNDATILCQMHLSDAYRAVLVWGPFPHLTAVDLEQESYFLEEISELVMIRILSLVQLSDSEHRTAAWGDVAGLLAHYSRRAMTPVSAGVRIISNHLHSGGMYSKEDALNACDSLEAATRFISQTVRSPLSSFAATAEAVYEYAPSSLHEIVLDCVSLYHPMTLDKMVTVKVDPSVAELPEIEIDATKMRDAVGYVLDNAIKYSHKQKEIRIYGKQSGRHVRLTIENFGQGIREEDRRLIFGRGYQGERSRKARYEEGEGLGLFHARLIVEAHKGGIWCGCQSGPRSEASARLEGYRVWFTFELPIKQSGA